MTDHKAAMGWVKRYGTYPHQECEDPWYSCPLSEYGCANDATPNVCTCHADKINNLVACYLEVLELAKAAYDSRILGHTDEEEALHAAMGDIK